MAIDQWYERNQDDAAGRFYQSIARQGPRSDLNRSTQGFYIATADGQLLKYGNHRSPDRMLQQIRSGLARFDASTVAPLPAPDPYEPDDKPAAPQGVLVARVNSKVLGGYARLRSTEHRIMQQSIGRDNLWITREDQQALAAGRFPESLAARLPDFT